MAKGKKDERKDGPLDRSPSHLLHRALQLALDVYAEEVGADAVTQRQFAVLSAVSENEGLTQTDLVRATGIDRSTLADMVARMIGKGLLARERSTTDARANTVRLTDAGRAELDAAREKVDAADRKILGYLPGGKRDSFLNILRELGKASDKRLARAERAETDPVDLEAERARKLAKKAAKADKKGDGDKKPRKKKDKDRKAA